MLGSWWKRSFFAFKGERGVVLTGDTVRTGELDRLPIIAGERLVCVGVRVFGGLADRLGVRAFGGLADRLGALVGEVEPLAELV